MTQAIPPARKRSRTKPFLLASSALALVAAVVMMIWTTRCPCETTPGFILFGDVQQAPVTDWTFANDVPFCQIQVSAYGLPHAINLNCFATPEGHLYLSCSVCARKFWAAHVGSNEHAWLRLNNRVYSVVLNRVTDPALMDQVWETRVKKVMVYGGQPYNPKPKPGARRPDTWWTFRVTSASGS
ncbi:MAG TPA: hypothetical protein VGY48_05895 [Vicinamibacterales bacterium]|jgi:hypothetical protein|nr:hypothetical protein [Vicinamibacterales bacterium]